MATDRFGKARHRPPGEWVQTTMAEDIAGIAHRKGAAQAFANAVRTADRKGLAYGVALAPQPDNVHDRNAIAVIGQCMTKGWLGHQKLQEWHVGFLPAELAAELQRDLLSKGITIASQLYEVRETDEGFIAIKIIVLAPPGHSHSTRLRKT